MIPSSCNRGCQLACLKVWWYHVGIRRKDVPFRWSNRIPAPNINHDCNISDLKWLGLELYLLRRQTKIFSSHQSLARLEYQLLACKRNAIFGTSTEAVTDMTTIHTTQKLGVSLILSKAGKTRKTTESATDPFPPISFFTNTISRHRCRSHSSELY